METRSKAQRDTVGTDDRGSGLMSGQGEIHPACDPSHPVLTPVGARATPVLMDESLSDAEQHQEHSDLQHRPEISTLVKFPMEVSLPSLEHAITPLTLCRPADRKG